LGNLVEFDEWLKQNKQELNSSVTIWDIARREIEFIDYAKIGRRKTKNKNKRICIPRRVCDIVATSNNHLHLDTDRLEPFAVFGKKKWHIVRTRPHKPFKLHIVTILEAIKIALGC
jgi:hypothetical protein